MAVQYPRSFLRSTASALAFVAATALGACASPSAPPPTPAPDEAASPLPAAVGRRLRLARSDINAPQVWCVDVAGGQSVWIARSWVWGDSVVLDVEHVPAPCPESP